MVVETLNGLEATLKACKNVSGLEPLSEECKSMTKYENKENLFQIQVSDENNRYIIYHPLKLLGLETSNGKDTLILDMLYIPTD